MSGGADQAVRVLVTGFGPFPSMPYNASTSVALALEGSAVTPGVDVATAIIPVVWATARVAARKAIARFQPHAVVHFGVSKRSSGFEIERRAFNLKRAEGGSSRYGAASECARAGRKAGP